MECALQRLKPGSVLGPRISTSPLWGLVTTEDGLANGGAYTANSKEEANQQRSLFYHWLHLAPTICCAPQYRIAP